MQPTKSQNSSATNNSKNTSKSRLDNRRHINYDEDSDRESIRSEDFPWTDHPRASKQVLIVPDSESGRHIQSMGFFLFMAASLLFSSGLGLGAVSLWVILHRLDYLTIISGVQYIGIGSFSICSAILSVPASWVSWATHNKDKVHEYLILLIVLLSFSLTMLSAGTCFAVIQKSKMVFTNGKDRTLIYNNFKIAMNETMLASMSNDDDAWNFVHKKFKCCGNNGATSWIDLRGNIPASCCENNSHSCNATFAYKVGCLDVVASDIHSELCLVIGLNSVVIFLQVFVMIFAIIIFILAKWRWADTESTATPSISAVNSKSK